jgi:hypothetical protein
VVQVAGEKSGHVYYDRDSRGLEQP